MSAVPLPGDGDARWQRYVEASEAAALGHLIQHGPSGAPLPTAGSDRVREEAALLRQVGWRTGDHPCRYCAGAALSDRRRR